MKFQSILPVSLAGAAFLGVACSKDNHCISDDDAKDLIHGYLTSFQGIPHGGSLAAVEAVAKDTFATDIKMYSQSFLWVRGYQGPVRCFPSCQSVAEC